MSPGEHPTDPPGAFEDAPCGLVRTDRDGLFLRANRTFCGWVGWEPHELVGKKRLQDLFTMGGRIFHQTHWQPLLQIQGSVSEVKLEFAHRDGSTLPMVLNAVRRERRGKVVHDVAAYVARDRDKYERELLLSRRKLEAAAAEMVRAREQAEDRALLAEQMMGIVSHDLRNPLSTILMGATVLAKQGATPQQMAVLGRIKRAADRANRLISQLLDFTVARLGSGLSVKPRGIDLHGAVRECVDELSLAFAGSMLRHQSVGEPQACVVDPDRLSQLIGNLVGNAMSYGDKSREVTVTSEIAEKTFSISVHNWGEPIAPQVMATIFEPLARGEAEGEVGSMGLGLYIVDQIARAHSGRVQVQSSREAGTVFCAEFPRQPLR
jgi:sigma-B regulation protein RsbU (phosphoserine phosphatase)